MNRAAAPGQTAITGISPQLFRLPRPSRFARARSRHRPRPDLLATLKPAAPSVGVDFSPAMLQLARERHPQSRIPTNAVAPQRFPPPKNSITSFSPTSSMTFPMSGPSSNASKPLTPHTSASSSIFLTTSGGPSSEPRKPSARKRPRSAKLALHRGHGQSPAPRRLGSHQDRYAHPLARRHAAHRPCSTAGAAPMCRIFCLIPSPSSRVPSPPPRRPRPNFRCSVVIPARNEAGNIEAAVQRTPEMGLGTEIIFIEGHSKEQHLG